MAERIITPQWRRQNDATKYPFAERATLTNDSGRVFVEGTFLDAILYPVGGTGTLRLSAVDVTHQDVTVRVGDEASPSLCSATFSLVGPPDVVALEDAAGRPAGILVSEGSRLGIFQSWGVGTHEFTRAQTEFCATVCVPTPELGVRGFVLEDGTAFVGDVWLVGADGVVFRTEDASVPASCGLPAYDVRVIRMDVVGDPLFRRRLCSPQSLFDTPTFIRTVTVVAPNQTFVCRPDGHGNLALWANNALAADTVLRVISTAEGVEIEAVGDASF